MPTIDPPPLRTIRLGAHLLGSLGMALLLGGGLAGCGAAFLRWFPWEATPLDRLSSLLCGASLMAVATLALAVKPSAGRRDDR
jgi:hypothetical protein